jgi:predicted nicotinamide N-methyase
METEALSFATPKGALTFSLSYARRTPELLSSTTDTTGQMPWIAAHLLAQLLCNFPGLLAGSNILELGCGSALLSCVCMKSGCAVVCATDGEASCLPIAVHNLHHIHNSISTTSGTPCCVRDVRVLRWGNAGDEEALLARHPAPFALALASEVFYHHRGGVEEIEAQGYSLFTCALRLLSKSGVLLVVYTPRYPKMSGALRAAGVRAGCSLRTINRSAALTAQLKATLRFSDTRLIAVARDPASLDAFFLQLGGPPCASKDDDSDYDEAENVGWEFKDSLFGQAIDGGLFD